MKGTLRDLAGRVAATRAVDAGVAGLERLHRGDGTLAVLTYHRIDEPGVRPELHPGLLSATPAGFRSHIEALAARWTPVSLDQVVAASHGTALPARAVLVTIDDAYDDVAQHAWPILRDAGVPAVLFVPTGYPDDPTRSFWWDDLHHAVRTAPSGTVATPVGALLLDDEASRSAAFRSLRSWFKGTPHVDATARLPELLLALGGTTRRPPVLGWDELRRLQDEGLALAPHSVSHAMLDRLDDERLAAEIRESRQRLADETGSRVPVFAYPSGQHDDRVVRAVADAGIEVAFTTRRGLNQPGRTDWLRVRRINVSHGMPPAAVRAQLLPAASAVASRFAP